MRRAEKAIGAISAVFILAGAFVLGLRAADADAGQGSSARVDAGSKDRGYITPSNGVVSPPSAMDAYSRDAAKTTLSPMVGSQNGHITPQLHEPPDPCRRYHTRQLHDRCLARLHRDAHRSNLNPQPLPPGLH